MHSFDIQLLVDLSYVVLALFVLLIAKVTLGFLTPFDTDDELTAKDNPAFGISLIGYYLGVLIVFLGAIHQDGSLLEGEEVVLDHFLVDLGFDVLWALGAVLVLNAARIVLDKVVLRGFSVKDEIVRDRNVGMGAVQFGTYVSAALVVAGAISGDAGETVGATLSTTVVFLLLGLACLIGFAFLYQRLAGYDLLAELEADNPAAGIAYGGNLIALGIVLMRGSAGTFVSWADHLERFAFYAAMGLFLVVVARRVIDGAFLTGRTLKEEIAEDRNVNAGYLEGGLLIGLAAVVALAI
ncbi:MAG: DUF350 domain-containing protein [Planctomycetes bacterium]|nr:DUF350 domain-containing protein [Planctomycetota bacterium]